MPSSSRIWILLFSREVVFTIASFSTAEKTDAARSPGIPPGTTRGIGPLTMRRRYPLFRATKLLHLRIGHSRQARKPGRHGRAARDDPDFDAPVFGVLVGFLHSLTGPLLHVRR